MKYVAQFLLFIIALAMLLALQYQYWEGENGVSNSEKLTAKIEQQRLSNNQQRQDNAILRADIEDLKIGLEAVEEHARLDLGLIKPDETFVQMSTAANTHRYDAGVSQTP